MQGNDIHIALSQNKIITLGLFRQVERKQVASLVKNAGVGRVEILGFGIIHYAPAERDDLPAHVNDGKHHAPTELVINRAFFILDRKTCIQQFFLGVALFHHRIHRCVKGIGRIAKPKPVHGLAGQSTPREILLHGRIFGQPKGVVIKPCGVFHQGKQPFPTVCRLWVGALLRHFQPTAVGQKPNRVPKFQALSAHNKIDDTAARTAAKTVVNLLVR